MSERDVEERRGTAKKPKALEVGSSHLGGGSTVIEDKKRLHRSLINAAQGVGRITRVKDLELERQRISHTSPTKVDRLRDGPLVDEDEVRQLGEVRG